MKFNWKKTSGAAVGASLPLAMLFANQLGLDNNSVWGAKRLIIFFAGIFILAVALLYREGNFIGKIFNSHEGRLYLGVGALGGAILIFYVWCVSIGTWSTWYYETNYYDLQAAAFRHGQIALEVPPDPKLLAFNGFDVYEPSNREGIPVLWDATLYKGRYYLYWGPAPALVLAAVKLFYTKEVGDNILTFAFLSGTFLLLVLVILELRKKYFSETPHWAVLLGIAFAGLVNPMTYILFEPRTYEAAIIAAQFFLIFGTYWLVTAFDRPTILRFALAGTFLAFAVGSRTTLIPAVGFLALITLIWAFKTQRDNAIKFTASIALPLTIGAVSYALYNYARFGSFTEFGLRYQLTSYNLYELLGETFSLAYIPPNLYKTLFNPFEIRAIFPYIFPTRWAGPSLLENANYPSFYLLLAESITGIFIGSPFMVFAFITGLNKNARWILSALAGSAFLSFFTLQIFFFTTMRYLLDLIPTLTILAVVGFWQGLNFLQPRRAARFSFAAVGILLSVYGFIVSFALALSAHFEQIRAVNPELLKQLTWLFKGWLK
ncbi:MAG: hypothetical protein PHQ36_13325 [Anaerolineales bacterium]|nr:hypothetical protein [Anaerolineales bacterium]